MFNFYDDKKEKEVLEKFTIDITCNKCGSKNIDVLASGGDGGSGYISINCRDCGNEFDE